MPMKITIISLTWRQMPLISVLWRQRQKNRFEFKASLVYKASSRTTRAVTQRNPVLETNKQKKKPNINQQKITIILYQWENSFSQGNYLNKVKNQLLFPLMNEHKLNIYLSLLCISILALNNRSEQITGMLHVIREPKRA